MDNLLHEHVRCISWLFHLRQASVEQRRVKLCGSGTYQWL